MAVCATTLSAMAWTWVGQAPQSGESYYLYTKNQDKFVNDANGLDGTPTVLWTIGGTPTDNYTLTSAAGNQFAMYRVQTGTIPFIGTPIYSYNVYTNATDKSGADINMSSSWNEEAQAYSLYRQDKNTNWSGDRNVASTASGLKVNKDASAEFRFVTEAEATAYANRVITFSATVGNAPVAGGSPTASLSVASYELQSYAEHSETKSVATFTANKANGYNFEGWFSASDFANDHRVSASEVYTVDLSYDLQSVTLYAKYSRSAVAPEISQLKTDLDWYTTYQFSELFESTSAGAITVSYQGAALSELKTRNESSITLSITQAAIAGKYTAITTPVELTFRVAPVEHFPAVLLDEPNESSKVEANDVYDLVWQNESGQEAGVLSFDYYTTGAATRPNPKVYQLLNGSWEFVEDYAKTTSWRTISGLVLNPAATGVRFEFAGTGLGSARVRNVLVTRRSYLASATESIEEVGEIGSPVEAAIVVDFGNIHTVQYELTDIAPATANIVLTTNDVPANGALEYGQYSFLVQAASEVADTITATAHFFTTEGEDLLIPITIAYPSVAPELEEQTLSWLVDEEDLSVLSLDLYEVGTELMLVEDIVASDKNLPVTLVSSNPNVIAIEEGMLVIRGAGTTTLTATQEGTEEVAAAEPLVLTIQVVGTATALTNTSASAEVRKVLAGNKLLIIRGEKVTCLIY